MVLKVLENVKVHVAWLPGLKIKGKYKVSCIALVMERHCMFP